ncbi:MAG TPA: OmpA family protein [Longimicrobiales bacterium]|nr:OmpA family protein [Longimicrobiales bacterium]
MTPKSTPRRAGLCALALLLVPLTSACVVKRSTYRAALGDLADAHAVQDDLRGDLERQGEVEDSLRDVMAELRDEITALEQRRRDLEGRLQSAADEVHRLEVMLSERGVEYEALQERLQALAAVEQEVRDRNRIYEDVIGRFRSLIDAGQLAVAIDRGRMVIELPQDILFPSGSATLSPDGARTLREVASVLASLEGRSFQVEGHTDNVPIATAQFPSNWELSSARALSVVRILIEGGVPPESLSGAGYGEHQPAASNDDRDSRRLNRRIEIVMLPNLDVIAETGLDD